MSPQIAKVPPSGEVSAHLVRFHVLFDSEFLDDVADATKFFVNGVAYAKNTALGKSFGHDTNVSMNGCLPQGMCKIAQRLSILCEDATDEDDFDVRFVFSMIPLPWFTVRQGSASAASIPHPAPRFVPEATPEERARIEERAKQGLRILGNEQFCVEVRAPERLRGKFTRVQLHGPILMASTA